MDVVKTIEIPAREGRATPVAAGQSFRVIDVEGGQVADLFAFVADDPDEYLSAQHTRSVTDRLLPVPGEFFVTNRRRPILLYEADDSPGVHDMLIAACDPERFALLGVDAWHASCQENLLSSLAEVGIVPPVVPQSVNLFMKIPVASDATLSWEPAATAAGDSVTFRAELDCIVCVSACPQDIVPINNLRPGPVRIELLG